MSEQEKRGKADQQGHSPVRIGLGGDWLSAVHGSGQHPTARGVRSDDRPSGSGGIAGAAPGNWGGRGYNVLVLIISAVLILAIIVTELIRG